MTPRAQILVRAHGVLANADLEALSGVPDINVRHTRNRWANPEETPDLAIRMVSDEVTENAPSAWEVEHEMQIDLQVTAPLQAEDSGLDPTGLDRVSSIANAAVTVLQDPTAQDDDGNTLAAVCDRVEDMGVVPDEDSEADEARFIHRINVIYRTKLNDPNTLLASGESAL